MGERGGGESSVCGGVDICVTVAGSSLDSTRSYIPVGSTREAAGRPTNAATAAAGTPGTG